MLASANARGAMFMTVSMAAFSSNDAVSKFVSSSINMGQLMMVRGLFALVLILALAYLQGQLHTPQRLLHRTVGLRVIGEVGATIFFLLALANMPLANASALFQALPLAVTMGAALFLGEAVGWRRWTAIGVGFLGVLIILRPGPEGFSTYSLMVLLAVLFSALRDLSTRLVPAEVSPVLMSTLTTVAVTITGAILVVPLGGWVEPTPANTAPLLVSAVFVLIGYQFVIKAMRVGEISIISPFRYTNLLFAVIYGILIFGELPDIYMIIGGLIVVGSGLYTLYREKKRGAERPVAESTNPGMAPDGT
ncbi:DMT family transporter [Limoniibacter endophyticus]|uniref:Membrane protein n=1 Tax=Limoniibacter endophyticus TaxID=1565040 RepID=A0A8J3DJZ3_9HYPH|nr:DMT family transporter [Limoniibacter endophyticus]GHC75851.1 membrane protein [Limoniibacter endophyticus]